MESLKFEVAPPAPRLNITATYDDIQKSPQLYFQVRYYHPCFNISVRNSSERAS